MNKIEQIKNSNFVITIGTMLSDNKEKYRDSIIESIAKNDTQFIYMHPVDNIDLKLYYNQFIKYEVGSEEGVCALLLDAFVKNSNESIKSYIDDLDLGYISAESSAGEEEFEEAYEKSQDASCKTLIIGDDLIEHDRIENIVKILAVIKKYSDLNLVVLNDDLEVKINSCDDENLEEIEDLKSFNGTLVYKLIDDNSNDELIASQTFANVAKVKNGDKIVINTKSEKIERNIKVDDKLHGTVAILKTSEDILSGYRYKQVKIEKVEG